MFTDRESGTYAGLMLTLRKYYDRLEAHPSYRLNKKPREIDCVIIDKKDPLADIDNDIARMFERHNIIELKNPREVLNEDTIWKTISYAAQYKSEGDSRGRISAKDVTITVLRASKPRKVLKDLRSSGYRIKNAYPGIYYIFGMVDMKMQIVVTSELKGDDYVPLRIQKRNASGGDYRLFARNVQSVYTEEEAGYVESVVKYGIYDEANAILELAAEDKAMYDKLMELFKDDIEKKLAIERAEGKAEGIAEGKAEGIAEGKAERKQLEETVKRLEAELKKVKAAML